MDTEILELRAAFGLFGSFHWLDEGQQTSWSKYLIELARQIEDPANMRLIDNQSAPRKIFGFIPQV